jgi:ABC-type lipoprotein export system ATPase subunit
VLNKNINIDLHIHSKISEYKEEKSIVEQSTYENIDVLIDKLDSDEHRISMFSFTDHNRFDSDLYINVKEYLKQRHNKYLETLLAGVEFDVLLEKDMNSCHIITIFNADSNDKLKHIEEIIEKYKLTKESSFYERKEFEQILAEIQLETLLIVCQRKDLSNQDGKNTSLSDSTSVPFDYLKFGYFNALEYQKPAVEGILRNNLSNIDCELSFVLGSDCHEWEAYPRHDKSSFYKSYSNTKIRCLATFKGLLLSLTSPSTRFKRRENDKSNYIEKLCLGDKDFELANGINAIIGENGSGKSLLINILTKNDNKIENYYKKLKKENNVRFDKKAIDRCQVVNQGEIIRNKYKNKLFGKEELYKEVDDSHFNSKMKSYSINIKSQIEKRIQFCTANSELINILHTYDQLKSKSTFFVNVTKEDKFEEIDNPHKIRKDNVNNALTVLKNEINSGYYKDKTITKFQKIVESLESIYSGVLNEYYKVNLETQIKNTIVSKINNYNLKKKKLVTAVDQEREDYVEKKNTLVLSVCNTIRLKWNRSNLKKIDFPKNIEGLEENPQKGFMFKRVKEYHLQNLESKFYEYMFNQGYDKYEDLNKIQSESKFAAAIKGAAGNKTKIKEQWDTNFSKFLSDYTKKVDYIFDSSDANTEIGNTLGEMSLVYYKYRTYNSSDWDILVTDQPEDNISNPKIKEALIEYLDSLRDNKQIIFVTHNPLLVVNLDVDNVIYIEKSKDKLKVISGCLEDESNNILSLVANKMDGGVETIEKRLKYYGKNY